MQRGEGGLFGIAQAFAVERGPDAGPQEHGIERFGQIILRPLLDARNHTFDLIERGNHDDRHVAELFVRLEPPQYFAAVDPRHHDVEQHKIEILRGQSLQGRGSVINCRAGVAFLFQPPLQHHAVLFLIVDNENFRRDGRRSDHLLLR